MFHFVFLCFVFIFCLFFVLFETEFIICLIGILGLDADVDFIKLLINILGLVADVSLIILSILDDEPLDLSLFDSLSARTSNCSGAHPIYTVVAPAPTPPVTVTLPCVYASVDVDVGLLTSVDVDVGLLTSVEVDVGLLTSEDVPPPLCV